MTTLTIYTPKFDSNENIVNNGMSGKAFLDMDSKLGFAFDDLDAALDYCFVNDISIGRVDFNYLDKDGIQMFKKL